MESVTLVQGSQDITFDVTKCIICQEATDAKTVSTTNGCKRIREASEIYNDHVAKRLRLIEGDHFVHQAQTRASS